MNLAARRRTGAFSLIELVIVVVIIGIIGLIAIPRMSRGSAGAADSALTANLAVLRNAIDLFQAEHDGTFPTEANIANQLTQYTNLAGAAQATKDTSFIYGPYLRAIPALPVGTKKGNNLIAAADAAGVGWIYDEAKGTIHANLPVGEVDVRGVPYKDY